MPPGALENVHTPLRKSVELEEGVAVQLRDEDFDQLGTLGHGNGGTVIWSLHRPTGCQMAVKLISLGPSESTPAIQQQIQSELEILRGCNGSCDHIVRYYGSFFSEHRIKICMGTRPFQVLSQPGFHACML